MSAPPRLCAECVKNRATLTCHSCRSEFCFDCGQRRHQVGNLRFHGMHILPEDIKDHHQFASPITSPLSSSPFHGKLEEKSPKGAISLSSGGGSLRNSLQNVNSLAPMPAAAANLAALPNMQQCEVCGMEKIIGSGAVFCLQCEGAFCDKCSTAFHKIGPDHAGSILSDMNEVSRRFGGKYLGKQFIPATHKSLWSSPIVPHTPTIDRERDAPVGMISDLEVGDRNGEVGPGKSLARRESSKDPNADLGTLVAAESVGKLKSTDVITLKLDSFGLSTSLQILIEMMQERDRERSKKPAAKSTLFFSFDCRTQTVKISDKSAASNFEFLRPFGALHSAKVSTVDPRHVVINFKTHSFSADCYCQNAAESNQIAGVVNHIRRKENLEFIVTPYDESQTDQAQLATDVMYKGVVQKRGKLSYAGRYVVVKRNSIDIYKDLEEMEAGTLPANSFTLLGVAVSRVGDKNVLIVNPEKDFEFKFDTRNEREMFFTVLQEAGGTKDDDLEDSQTGRSTVHRKSITQSQLLGDSEAEPSLVVPAAAAGKVFLLMRLIRKSIEEGVALTPKIFVPREVWFQKDLKLPAYSVKNTLFAQLLEKLRVVSTNVEDPEKFIKSMAELVDSLATIQNGLAQHLTYIHGIKKAVEIPNTQIGKFGAGIKKFGHSLVKKATRATAASAKVDSDGGYAGVIMQILALGELFESWEKDLEKELVDSLGEVFGRVKEFFREVFLAILLTDLKSMLKKYIKDYNRPFD
eukprot:TRINITY_DN19823_c0_g1_i1.p1 TRINITY_DN19823_c0_g1~~TRINITY_DN19823_c0_g1_i1.p1  ORF type:complete len:748 (-),score=191.75 TRINITY_DN19823_c0_g1_i1:40-2283(-)